MPKVLPLSSQPHCYACRCCMSGELRSPQASMQKLHACTLPSAHHEAAARACSSIAGGLQARRAFNSQPFNVKGPTTDADTVLCAPSAMNTPSGADRAAKIDPQIYLCVRLQSYRIIKSRLLKCFCTRTLVAVALGVLAAAPQLPSIPMPTTQHCAVCVSLQQLQGTTQDFKSCRPAVEG